MIITKGLLIFNIILPDEEIRFMVSHLPIEIDSDPTEEIEVSNYKDLPRISTNLIRGGITLVTAEGAVPESP